jgi:O-antigen/teichoic acid export membrane protein
MKKQKIILRVLLILILIIAIASVIIYFILVPEKPWMAFYVACCGGILVVNLILSMIFVKRNIR